MNQEIIKLLLAPFSFEEVKAKIQVYSNDKTKGMAVFYLDSRAIQKRLDETVGTYKWANQYSPWQNNAQICGISIFNEERNEWVTKHDGAENSDIEATKGGLSDAFKRAAVLWGIGRYLYQIDGVWVEVEPRGKGYVIKENQKGRLKATYEAAVKNLFGVAANNPTAGNQSATQPTAPSTPQNAISNPPQPTSPLSNDKQAPLALVPPLYKIHSIKPSGKGSQLLELCDCSSGEIKSAYVKAGQQGIVVGKNIQNVHLEEKEGTFGKYNLLASYQAA